MLRDTRDVVVIWHGAIEPSPFGLHGRGELLPAHGRGARPRDVIAAKHQRLEVLLVPEDNILLQCSCGRRHYITKHQRAWLSRNGRPEPMRCPGCRTQTATATTGRHQGAGQGESAAPASIASPPPTGRGSRGA